MAKKKRGDVFVRVIMPIVILMTILVGGGILFIRVGEAKGWIKDRETVEPTQYIAAVMADMQIEESVCLYPIYICDDNDECTSRILKAVDVPIPLNKGDEVLIWTHKVPKNHYGILPFERIERVFEKK